MTLSFTHDEAYKLLLRFRHVPAAIAGFIKLNGSNIMITDPQRSQCLLGRNTNGVNVASIYNFSGNPYGDILDGLCALSSSSSPLIVEHRITGDELLLEAFEQSRLEGFCVSKTVSRTALNLTLTANIRYPS